MLNYIRRMLKDRRGFTLIELMVVVVIIGILAAIAVPQFMGQSDKAKKAKANADLKTIGSAIEMYYTAENGLPDPNNWQSNLVNGKYLASVPKTPWNNDYGYSQITYNPGNNIYVPFTLYYQAPGSSTPVYYPPTQP
ncbi:prepilin-type N-terminal cleavage/methylation domain-containing protein [Moorella naiadis]|uniref:prepilin-type N-terminal cleavage/methylation domain-containing protein n=1 Tax=Moorella naiadis (nom. illeg.) TaxID=3093670 RepID=UPI003D9CBA68